MVGDDGPALTYAALCGCIVDAASRLRGLGFGTGDRFAVVVDGSIESVATRRWCARPSLRRLRQEAALRAAAPRANTVDPESLALINDAAQAARVAYRPRPFHGPVLLLRSIAPRPYAHYMPKMGWAGYVHDRAVELRLWCDRPEIWRPPFVQRAAAAIEDMIRVAPQ